MSTSTEQIDILRERNNYGVLSGLTKKEAAEQHPTELAKIEQNKIYHDVHESESYEDTKTRALTAFAEVSDRPENTVGVVSHGGIISTIMREKFGYQSSKIGDCGYVEMDYSDGEYEIKGYHNMSVE